MTPAQAQGPFATLLETEPRGGYRVADPAYLRVRITGFVVEDGTDIAIVEPIERGGEPCDCPERRSVYFVPLKHLVPGATVAVEIKLGT